MSKEEDLKLLGTWASPFSLRIEIALKMKGIPYEYIEEDLSNKSPSLLKYNPVHKKIPVLVHNEKPVAESAVILEYIDETWSTVSPLLPQDPHDRAMTRFWAKFVDDKIVATAVKYIKAKDKEEQEEASEEAQNQLKFLEEELKGKAFFGGESIGYLDIMVFLVTYWFQLVSEISQVQLLTQDKFPALYNWTQKLLHMAIVKETLPPRDKHIAFLRSRFDAAKSATK